MASVDEEVQTLTHLGLTCWQARVYLALAQSGMATAKKISRVSGIPRQHIYSAVFALQELGLVEKIIAIPLMFKAAPIQDGLSILMDRKARETLELRTKTRELLQKLKKSNTRETLKEEWPQFVLIPKDKAGFKKRKKAFENAQKSIDVITSWRKHASVLLNYTEILDNALKRGVTIRVITEKPKDENSSLKIEQNIQANLPHKVRYICNPLSAETAIYDKKEVFIDVSVSRSYGECPALWSNNPCLLAIVQDYFEMMWLTALEYIPKEP